jgi:hypothetical protein
MVSTIIAIAIVYQILMSVLHVTGVVNNDLNPLQLNYEIVPMALKSLQFDALVLCECGCN